MPQPVPFHAFVKPASREMILNFAPACIIARWIAMNPVSSKPLATIMAIVFPLRLASFINFSCLQMLGNPPSNWCLPLVRRGRAKRGCGGVPTNLLNWLQTYPVCCGNSSLRRHRTPQKTNAMSSCHFCLAVNQRLAVAKGSHLPADKLPIQPNKSVRVPCVIWIIVTRKGQTDQPCQPATGACLCKD